MRLFGLVDGAVDRFDRAGWLTMPFDLAFQVPAPAVVTTHAILRVQLDPSGAAQFQINLGGALNAQADPAGADALQFNIGGAERLQLDPVGAEAVQI